jgi:tRNA(Ile)-lysidine synthase
MNLIRGAGINGLSGIKPISENVIHPLLCFEKSELVSLLRAEGIGWREDRSNNSSIHRRNVVRSKLIPLIEAELNPSFTDKICKQAEIFRKSDALISSISAKKLRKALIDQDGDSVVLSIPDLMKLSDVERFYIFRSVYARLVGRDIDFFSHSYEELIGICRADGSKWTSLQNGILARKQYDELSICTSKSNIETTIFEAVEVEEDRAFFVHMDYRFAFKHFKVMSEDLYAKSSPHTVVVDADKLKMPFRIRSRATGDRFVPLGMKSHKKLKEFFIDEKVPKFERDMIPVLEDKEKIFWVVGHRIDERVKCDENTSHFLQITADRLNTGRKRPANRK